MRDAHPFRTNAAGSQSIPRPAGWIRLARWWFRRGPHRLKLARVRREAVFGNPLRALTMLVGAREARGVICVGIRKFPDTEERMTMLRRALSDACMVCGARWSEPCDAGLHS